MKLAELQNLKSRKALIKLIAEKFEVPLIKENNGKKSYAGYWNTMDKSKIKPILEINYNLTENQFYETGKWYTNTWCIEPFNKMDSIRILFNGKNKDNYGAREKAYNKWNLIANEMNWKNTTITTAQELTINQYNAARAKIQALIEKEARALGITTPAIVWNKEEVK